MRLRLSMIFERWKWRRETIAKLPSNRILVVTRNLLFLASDSGYIAVFPISKTPYTPVKHSCLALQMSSHKVGDIKKTISFAVLSFSLRERSGWTSRIASPRVIACVSSVSFEGFGRRGSRSWCTKTSIRRRLKGSYAPVQLRYTGKESHMNEFVRWWH